MSSSAGPYSGISGTFDQIPAGDIVNAGGLVSGAGSVTGDLIGASPEITHDFTSVVFVYTSGVTLNNGDTLEVVEGGSAFATTVNSGGLLEVVQGGVAFDSLVNSGGVVQLAEPGSAGLGVAGPGLFWGGAVSAGGTVGIYDGGTLYQADVDGGFVTVSNGGLVLDDTIGGGAFIVISSGGTIFNSSVLSGAELVLLSGASGGGMTIAAGVDFLPLPGAVAFSLNGQPGAVVLYNGQGVSGLDFIGATANGIDVGSGLIEYVAESYASAMGGAVANGGTQFVYAGGNAISTTIGNAGTEFVFSHGNASGAIIESGGKQFVYSSGESFGTVVNSGGLAQDTASAISTTINDGGLQQVATGTAAGTVVRSGGTEQVLTHGTAIDPTVDDGGFERVSLGGTLRSATILSGGAAIVSAGGFGIGDTVSAGGVETVQGGDYQQEGNSVVELVVVSGGLVQQTTIQSGGEQDVFGPISFGYGGTAFSAVISSGGAQVVFSGGVASSTTVSGGGAEIVLSGGFVTGTVVDPGGALIVMSGGSESGTTGTIGGAEVWQIEAGGTVAVYGANAVAVAVNAVGTLYAQGGGTAISTTINEDGAEVLFSGGVAISTTLNFAATENISSGGTAGFTTVRSGGFQYVSSGGTATCSIIDSGGQAFVQFGGAATGAVVNFSGQLHITDNGVATGTTVNSGGYDVVSIGGIASATTINGGGFEYVSSGTAIGATVSSGGFQVVSSGGTAGFTAISNGGVQNVFGVASGAIVASAGFQDIYAGGLATGTVVDGGGTGEVYFGGTARAAIVANGGTLSISAGGQAVDAIVSGGGTIDVNDNGVTSRTTVLGGFEAIGSGGIASDTTLRGGEQSDNGSALHTTVSAGGTEDIGLGGYASGSIIDSGGNAFVLFGGGASDVTVNNDATLSVSNGGVANATIVNSGGVEDAGFGATAGATTIDSGGIELIHSHGSGLGTTISGGGLEAVFSGGIASNVTVDPGGTLLVFSGGTVNGSAGGTTGSGVFLYSASGPLFQALGDNAGPVTISGQAIEFVLTSGTAVSATVNSGGQQIVIGGTASATVVNNGGSLYVSSGGNAVSATIDGGGSLYVTAGGTATYATVAGSAYVDTGGLLISATITGYESVSGGAAISNSVTSGGVQVVTAGGTASGTIVETGGEELVASGGVARNTVVEPGGTLIVAGGQDPGVTFSNILPLNGGTVTVGAPSVPQLDGITVEGPGTLLDQSTLTVDNETLIDGATLAVNGGALASLNGGRLFGGSGAVLIDPAGTFALLAASAFQTGGSVTITNNGLFEAATGNSNIDADFVNTNALTIAAGTLTMADTYSDPGGGGVTLAAGAEIVFNQANDYTGAVTGPGTVDFAGGGTIGSTFVLTTPTILTANTLTFGENQTFNAANGVSGNLDTAYRAAWILNGHTVTFGPSLTSTFGVPSGNGLNVQSGSGGGEIVNETSIALDGDTFGGVTLLDEGLATVNGGGVFGGGTITVAASGTLDLLSGSSFQAGASQQIVNDGLFEETAGNSNVGATFSNSGSVLVLGGTLSFQNGFTGGGFVSIAAGAEVAFGQSANYIGVITGAGTADFAGGGAFAPLLMLSVPTIDMGGTITFGADQTFNAQNGTADYLDTAYRAAWILNGHTVTFGPSLTSTFGVPSGNGLNIQSGSGGEIINQTSIALDGDTFGGVTLLDEGLATVNGGGVFGGGSITVAASATIDLLSGSSFQANASQQIVNNGLFEATAGISNVGATFSNSGSVSVLGGTLAFQNGFTGGGTVSIAAGAEVAFNQANTYAPGTIAGAGSVFFAGGTIDAGLRFAVSNVVLDGGDSLYFGENFTFTGSLMTNYRSGFVLNGNTVTFGAGLAATFGVPSGYGLYIGGGVGGGEVINQTSIALDGDTIDGITLQDQDLMTLASGDNVFVGGTGSGTIGIASGATFSVQAGGNVNQNGLVIDNAGLLQEIGGSNNDSQYGSVNNTGTILVTSGTMTLHDGVSGTGGTAIVDPGTTLELGGSFSQAVTLSDGAGADGAGATLLLDQPGDFTGTLYGIGAGDAIAFHAAPSSAHFNGSTLVAVLNGTTYDYTLAAPAIGDTVSVSGDTIQIMCFAEGTRIATPEGPVAVEDLAAGDHVLLADGGWDKAVWIGSRRIDCGRHPRPRQVWPIRVRAGAFGKNCPARDLFLSPDHAVFVADVLIPIRLLVDGEAIDQTRAASVTYYHVELERHGLLLAEGLAVESYLETGDRAWFDNTGDVVRLFPEFALRTERVWESEACAPLVQTGAKLEAARAAIRGTRRRQRLFST